MNINISRPNSVNGASPKGRGRGRGRGRKTPDPQPDSPSSNSNPPLSFENFSRVSSFKIGPNGEYLPEGKPSLLRLPERLTRLKVDLNEGFGKARLLTRDPKTGQFVPDCLRGRALTSNADANAPFNDQGDSGEGPKISLDIYMQFFYNRLLELNYFERCRIPPQFVVSGRSLSGMMQTPYDEDSNWDFLVTKVGGIIFMVYQTSPISVKLFNLKFSK